MEIIAGTDPFILFQSWYDEAVKTEVNDPDAIAIATVDMNGMPSVRMVLLRRWSPDGFGGYHREGALTRRWIQMVPGSTEPCFVSNERN